MSLFEDETGVKLIIIIIIKQLADPCNMEEAFMRIWASSNVHSHSGRSELTWKFLFTDENLTDLAQMFLRTDEDWYRPELTPFRWCRSELASTNVSSHDDGRKS